MPPRVAIVGAGIGGLAAAHHLGEEAARRGVTIEVVVLEASERVGGLLATEHSEGALLERGPDTLVTHKPAGLALCEQLGLGERVVFPPAGRIEILDGDRLLPVPAGFALLAPTRRLPLLASPLLSWRGKLRALAEPFVRAGGLDEESVASFVRRRFGDELYRKLAEPVVGGIYMADAERLSLAATFPRFAQLERERGRRYGSGEGGARQRPGPRARAAPPAATLDGGLGQITDVLTARLPAGSLRLRHPVERLVRDSRGFVVKLAQGPALAAEAVLVALPAHAAAPLLSELDPALATEMHQISYASCVTIHLAWPRRAVKRLPQSHGFFVPRTAASPVVAATFISTKFPERVPVGEVVARVFLGGALHPEAVDRADAELVDVATSTLAPLLDAREPPAWSRVWRHPRSMPQRTVGHPALAARLTIRLANHPGLALAGGPLGAYGLPDSIAAGEAAAGRLLDWLGSRSGAGG